MGVSKGARSISSHSLRAGSGQAAGCLFGRRFRVSEANFGESDLI